MTQEYPLAWPDGWPRARARKPGQFHKNGVGLTMSQGERRILEELHRMHPGRDAYDVLVVSSNVIRDRAPEDPGVAVYFQRPGEAMRVIAIDRYDRAPDNAAAIAATLEAMRAIDRHGGAQILERAFKGFDALPAPGVRSWRDVLGFTGATPTRYPTLETVEARFRELAQARHPDKKTGSVELMKELLVAREAARQELGA